MKTATDQQEGEFRPINLNFLTGEIVETFDLFYKTEAFGTTRFVKFASTAPEHQDKVRRMVEEGESTGEYFVRQEDLMKYYQQATENLRTMISNPDLSLKEKTQKIYNVSKEIMQEFFEFNASEKVLKSSEEVMRIMDDCLSEAQADFHSIFMITNKDYYTYTHSVNVGLYCLAYGVKNNMGENDIRNLGLGGMLHDVGKVKIDAAILNKNGKLTDEEFETIKTHSPLGKEMLVSMKCYASDIVDMAHHHHERFKGNGYPDGLVGEEISLFSRICKIMDVYDALTTRRSYKKALAPFAAINLMGKQMADEFDLEIFRNFVQCLGPDL